MPRPFVIAIAAVSGGGKTTIVELLNRQFNRSQTLHFDDYTFEGPEDLVDWARRGGDHNEWKLDPLIQDLKPLLNDTSSALDYVFLDYPFAYLNTEINEYIDLTLFLDTPLDMAMARRILRDYAQSTGEEIRRDMEVYLSGAREAYLNMLRTVKPNSDIIIDGNQEKEQIVEQIQTVMKQHEKVKRENSS